MRIAFYGLIIFIAGIVPGLVKHGQPLPHSGRNVAQPVAAYSAADDKPGLLALLSRWKKA
jgi:hypothetical protein